MMMNRVQIIRTKKKLNEEVFESSSFVKKQDSNPSPMIENSFYDSPVVKKKVRTGFRNTSLIIFLVIILSTTFLIGKYLLS